MAQYLNSEGLKKFKSLADQTYQNKFVEIPKSKWYTQTPFVSPDDVIQKIYKCSDVIPGYTKWLLILYEKSEDRTFNAYYINNKNYAFSTHKYKLGNYMEPWELFLSDNCQSKTVKIGY